ncbi:solute carrier family 35 member G1-like isoform X1 [Varroa jacobsoni]|uniref:solute carrier family 35 member G1-like isoform X1 n=1 Tax=Varroa jacobsoni TaxID=62625 RepID=UPI000BF9DFFC|nr:solute carrier family 35 member G1-like isoform X1 [Varroa jacobsoni]XP_022698265.1 solute carrier family 35 member G1-like isoform X1 [Varroa jacobsoni]XP_022698266.1 solute carrier family 35 member G1-like isoform X1 [Varroa jacobsoni]XP_022698267.1 solute carrier family 35 member G1-like isoform X1 [Varroa jacobsoni]
MLNKIREKIAVIGLSAKTAHCTSNDNEDTRALVSQSSVDSNDGAHDGGGSSTKCQLDSMSVELGDSESGLSLQRGLLLAAASSFFFSLCSVIVKKLDYMHPGELACLRFVGIFMCTLPYVLARRQSLLGPKDMRGLLILRGLAGSTSLFLRFCALHYLPLADASVIIFSVPVFVTLMAKFFLNESCPLFHWVSISITLLGIALITKLPMFFGHDTTHYIDTTRVSSLGKEVPLNVTPDSTIDRSTSWTSVGGSSRDSGSNRGGFLNTAQTFLVEGEAFKTNETESSDRLYGTIAALASTIFAASVYVLLRKLRDIDPFVVLLNLGWVAVIETALLTLILGRFTLPRTGYDQLLVIGLALCSFLGQVCLTRALQSEQAGPVSVVRSSADIALVFVWQVIIFSKYPDQWTISGALIVSACVILSGLRKWLLSLPNNAIAKRRLRFLTL